MRSEKLSSIKFLEIDMTLNKISHAIAGLCAVAAAPAFALPSTDYTNTGEFVGDTLNIRISGATAVDPGVIASAVFLCDTTAQIHRYSIQNNAVVFCKIDQVKLPGTGKDKLAVYKYSIGGSGGGVANVNNGTLIPYIDLTKLAANCAAGTNVTNPADLDGTNPLPTFVDTLCAGASNNTATTTNAQSYIGISDVEPQFFGLAAGTYDNLQAGALASVLFGAPVTQNAYIALQRAQGLSTTGGGTCTPDEQAIAACIPSLTQAQLTSMYTQPTQTWPALTGATIRLADNTTVSADQRIYVSRRANTSGTQKTYEALIARTGNTSIGGRFCQPSVDSFVTGPNANDNAAAVTACNGTNQTVRNSGSNQVLVCMNTHDTAGRGSIGVLSLEYKQTLANNVRFTKINGVMPTYAGVASGAYTFYGDVSLNQRVATANGAVGTQAALGYPAYITAMKANFANPATIEIINGSSQPFGPSGIMALDALATPTVPVADFTGATARNPWSRLVGGSTLNNCQPGKAAKL